MRKNLLLIACSFIMVLSVSAQDTLKVNFKPAGNAFDQSWDSILVADKTEFDQASTYNIFDGVVLVKPVWKTTTVAANYRSIYRKGFSYTGKDSVVLSTFIAADIRQDNDCDAIGVEITNLPIGTYTFESYHHDFNDQHTAFTVSTSVGGTVVDEVTTEMMVSHSIDTAEYNLRYPIATYPDAPFSSPEMAKQFQDTYVTNSIDSITTYKFKNIQITAAAQVVSVLFKSPFGNDPDISHNRKLILINGFKLSKNDIPGTSIENIASNAVSVYPNPASETLKIDFQSETQNEISFSVVDITGKTVLMNTLQLMDNHLDIDISKLPKGAYFLKLSLKEEQIVRKFSIM